MRLLRAIVVAILLPGIAVAQADKQSLADVRQELEVVYVMIQGLKKELSTTRSPGMMNAGGSFQERIDAIESALSRLTERTEELENRIEKIVADGTMRIGDLEFRLVELEGGDVSKLGKTTTLGGAAAVKAPAVVSDDPGDGPALAVGEQDDFDRALQAYEQGDYKAAVQSFQTFNESYPSSPLSAAAHLYRGLSLEGLGQTADAARAYLNAFSVDPNGAEAPAALLQLGLSLSALGQTSQACVTLAEVGVRFPDDVMVAKANTARNRIGCS